MGALTRATVTDSIADAEQMLAQKWSTSYRKSDLTHSAGLLEIRTGQDELDTLLRQSQTEMSRLWMSSTGKSPHPMAVSARLPDTGHASRADGGDYPPGWWGLSAWDMHYAVRNLLLPGQAEQAAGLFHNFIQLQQGFGEIDLRPGLGGQRTRLLAPPLLADCALEIVKSTGNTRRLAEAYPILNYFLQKWQDPDHDRDQDHLPEWQHPFQTGWTDNPLWNAWQTDGKGYAIETIESPAQGAMLYRELRAMQQMARLLGKPADAETYAQDAERIRTSVGQTWDKRRKGYRYRDRDTHATPAGRNITRAKGAGSFPIDRTFESPTRLALLIETKQDITRPISIDLIGLNQTGQHVVESIPQSGIVWRENRSTLTSRQVFQRLESVQITGLAAKDEWQLTELDLTQADLSLLLPLWRASPPRRMPKRWCG